MPSTVIIGTQWGDEGKGKVVDVLAGEHDMVVRFQGGNNAGHTLVVGGSEFKLHVVPSGIIRPGVVSVIGNGVVVDPGVLLDELRKLDAAGVETGELRISDRAHVIMPYHRQIDGLEEGAKGNLAAGTTRRGIGPCYADKMSRFGIRICDLLEPDELEKKLRVAYPVKAAYIRALGGEPEHALEDILAEYLEYGRALASHVCDTSVLVNRALAAGRRVLFEGAQGVHLDIDHGIYPYGTSSSTVSGGVCTGTGIPPGAVDRVLGVVKAYTSRVGTGPFPTELDDETGRYIARAGNEFGTTTGRPRRVGWLDLVMLRHSARISGLAGMILTKADVLGGLDTVRVCTHYMLDGAEVHEFPGSMKKLERCRPAYHELEGWPRLGPGEWQDISTGGRDALPSGLKSYITLLEAELNTPVVMLSYGPGRDQIMSL